MNREELIKEVAKILNPTAWEPPLFHDSYGSARRDLSIQQARAAFAVFEKAHAPIANHPWSLECGLCLSAAHIQPERRVEPEWDYGCDTGAGGEPRRHSSRSLAEDDSRGVSTITRSDGRVDEFPRSLVRRRKAGPWEPVPDVS